MDRIENLVKDNSSSRQPNYSKKQETAVSTNELSINDILSSYKVLPARIHSKSTGVQATPVTQPKPVTEAPPSQPAEVTAVPKENTAISMFCVPAGAYELVGDREGVKWSYLSHAANTGSNDAPTMLEEILRAAPATGSDQGRMDSEGVMDALLPSDGMLVMSHDATRDDAADRERTDDDFSSQLEDKAVFSPRHQAYFSRAVAEPVVLEQPPPSAEGINQEPSLASIPATPSAQTPFFGAASSNTFASGKFNRTIGSTANANSSLMEELLARQQESIDSSNEIVKLLVEQLVVRDIKAETDRNQQLESQTKAAEAMSSTIAQVSDRLTTVLDKYVTHEITKTDTANQQLLQAIEEQLQHNNANNNEVLREMIVDNVVDVLQTLDLQSGNRRENKQGANEITFRNEFGFLRSTKLSDSRLHTHDYDVDPKNKEEDDSHNTSETSSVDDSVSVCSEPSSAAHRLNALAPDFERVLLDDIKRSQQQCRHDSVSIPNIEADIDPLFVMDADVEKKDMFWLWENPDGFLRRQSEITPDDAMKSPAKKGRTKMSLPVPFVSSVLEQPATRARLNMSEEDFDALLTLDDEDEFEDHTPVHVQRSSSSHHEVTDRSISFDEYSERENDSSDMSNILSPLELRLLKGNSSR